MFLNYYAEAVNDEKQSLPNADVNSNCMICKNPIRENPLRFSCGHNFCLTCFSIPLVNSKFESNPIKNSRISYYEWNLKLPCVVCNQGSFIVTNDMNVDFSKAPAESQKIESNKDLIKKPCQECNITQASLWCQHCRLAYCLKCEKSIHCFKSFQHHKTMDYSVYIENNCKEKKGLFSNCNCGFNQELEMFCSTCQKFMCKVCSVSDLDQQRSCYSRNHAIKSTYDMWNAFQHNIGTGGSLEMNFAKEQFPIQKNMFMQSLENDKAEFFALCDFIIHITETIKDFCEQNSPNKHLKQQLLLIQESFPILNGEISSLTKPHTLINPLRLYYLTKINPKEFISNAFPKDDSKYDSQVRIIDKEMIEKFIKFRSNLENLDNLSLELDEKLVKAYDVEKLITDGEAEISDANRALVAGISTGELKMKTCSKGHDNDRFQVQMEEIKSDFQLEAGTVWVAKNDKNNEFQPLIQKNSCKFEPGKEKQNLYMFCGDQNKSSPHDQEYIPTTVKLKTISNQHEVWEKTKKYAKR